MNDHRKVSFAVGSNGDAGAGSAIPAAAQRRLSLQLPGVDMGFFALIGVGSTFHTKVLFKLVQLGRHGPWMAIDRIARDTFDSGIRVGVFGCTQRAPPRDPGQPCSHAPRQERQTISQVLPHPRKRARPRVRIHYESGSADGHTASKLTFLRPLRPTVRMRNFAPKIRPG